MHRNFLTLQSLFKQLVLSALCLLPHFAYSAEAEDCYDFAVATVEDDTIWHSEFCISDEAYSRMIKAEAVIRGEIPGASNEPHITNDVKRRREAQLLAAKIRSKVSERVLVEYQIVVTDRELAAKREALYGADGPEAFAERARMSLGYLSSALDAVYERGEHTDRVYEEYLADKTSISPTQWKLLLIQGERSEYRDNMKKFIASGGDSSFDADRQVRSLIVGEKLRAIVDNEIAVSDTEYAVFIKRGRLLPSGDPMESMTYEEEMRDAWWREQYRKAEIEILDDRFKDALRLLLEEME